MGRGGCWGGVWCCEGGVYVSFFLVWFGVVGVVMVRNMLFRVGWCSVMMLFFLFLLSRLSVWWRLVMLLLVGIFCWILLWLFRSLMVLLFMWVFSLVGVFIVVILLLCSMVMWLVSWLVFFRYWVVRKMVVFVFVSMWMMFYSVW